MSLVIGIHFVCKNNNAVTVLPDGTFETAAWRIGEHAAKSVRFVALHQRRSERSYRQGEVVGRRPVIDKNEIRYVFRVKPDASPVDWVGGGSGEKGYVWA